MARVSLDGHTVALAAGETVLEGLLRVGVAVPHSCRAGACQSCVLRATAGTPPADAQAGLRETWKQQGYFLACRAKPSEDLTLVRPGDAGRAVPAVIADVARLSPSVLRVRVEPREPFAFRPGQFVHLLRPDGVFRAYSLAGLDEPGAGLEMHVRVLPGGRVSGWLADGVKPGDPVAVRGPLGECFYVPGRPDQPLLLAGTGTGLAPLVAIARDALRHGHTAPVWLFHGALDRAGLYLVDELRELARRHPALRYCPVVLHGDAPAGGDVGPLAGRIDAHVGKTAGVRAYLCGDPALVQALRKHVFLKGARMAEIFSDAFAPAAG